MQKINQFICYFSLFLVIFLSSSFVIVNNFISSLLTIVLWIITAILLFAISQKFDVKMLLIFILLVLCVFVTTVVFNENFRTFLCIIFSYFTAFLYVQRFSLKRFCNSYVSVMVFLSIISLIGFISYNLFPQLYQINVEYINTTYSNLILYVDTQHYNRNMGMFWEPGAFQTFLNIALYFEIIKENYNKKNIILLIATIITTYSTTGYIALILNICLLVRKIKKNTVNKIWFILAFFTCFLVVFLNQEFLFGSSLQNGQSTVFGKIINFNIESNVNSSASIRFNAIIKPLEYFFKSPIIGHGYDNLKNMLYEYTMGMNTCTFINFFAVYGILYGSIMLYGIIKFLNNISKKSLLIVALLIFFIVTMSENYVTNPLIMIISLYGYKYVNYNEQIKMRMII